MSQSPARHPEQDKQDARVLSRHLDPGFSADFDGTSPENIENGSSSNSADPTIAESSLRLQGGDIHRDLYRINERSKRAKLHQRAATFSHPREYAESEHDELPVSEQLVPGGFRRQFLERQGRRVSYITSPVTKNFVSFLELYGNFAGEDLEESDDEEAIEDEEEAEEVGERRPLLGRRKSSKRVRAQGDAGNLKSFFTLLKAFVGTGIMFLPKAFKNGGMLFSSITLIVVSLVTSLCFHLLLQCRARYGGGYGELGEAVGGRKLRSLILTSIAISQIGFVCAGIIFTADNLSSFLAAVTPNTTVPLSVTALIGIQLIALIPLSYIRNISKLGSAALLADVFILIGLTYIYWYDISSIVEMGGFNPTIELFNPRDFTLTVGSAIFTFEGIGLILPIQSSMKHPEHFDKLLYLVMLIITIIFTSVGVLCYGTFGDRVSVEVITNFPQSSKLVNAVQFLYALAVMIGEPVQLFPAIRIMETKIFGHRSGKQSNLTKWKKNGFRTLLVMFAGLIAAVGASDLDKFVALIGSFACVPLVYIYPAFLHFKGVAETKVAKGIDVTVMVVGLVAMVYTTSITIARWTET
ncbi:amino acid transporter-like protein [Melanomma pulvis-pyrius CBS 109.77]|uniref:Amino acid transporter-like protein n=1 Tax=Melanomma pulvis-pyrius CBS 109.77 TaxID=1314802 RepID=A0A6A6XQR3_9PLEO|nr:amino acid transporter-like protein [Melanomma pulvis-pyrius CBS 109.77]